MKRKNLFFAFLSGAVAALGFYTFYAARVTIILVMLYLFLFVQKSRRKILIVLLLGFALILAPFVYVNRQEVITQMIRQTFIGRKEVFIMLPLAIIWRNMTVAVRGIITGTPHTAHYVSGSFVDPLSNFLAAVGFFSLLKERQIRMLFFLSFCVLLMIFITGGLFYTANPPPTRLFMVLPFIFSFSANGLNELVQLGKRVRLFPHLGYTLGVITILVAAFLNLHRFYIKTPPLQTKTGGVEVLKMLIKGKVNGKNTVDSSLYRTYYSVMLEAYEIR